MAAVDFDLSSDHELIRRTVREFAEGEVAPVAEPEAGSDAGNTRTRAQLDGEEWVINGAKQFITNAGTAISGLVCITAVTGSNGAGTGDGGAEREISNLIVPNGAPGYTQGAP